MVLVNPMSAVAQFRQDHTDLRCSSIILILTHKENLPQSREGRGAVIEGQMKVLTACDTAAGRNEGLTKLEEFSGYNPRERERESELDQDS
nr:hypothetical protein BaRGS_018627 [Batillaria attramentaria]